MPLIQTNYKKLFTTSLIAGLFCLVMARHGLPHLYSNKSIDALVILTMKSAIGFGILFYIAHHGIRWAQLNRDAAYMIAGAACLIVSYLLGPGVEIHHMAKAAGYASAVLAAPAIMGVVIGYIYWKGAGYDTDNDDVDALAKASSQLNSENSTVDLSYISTREAEYYNGPLQVRSSFIAAGLGGMMGGLIYNAVVVFYSGIMMKNAMHSSLSSFSGGGFAGASNNLAYGLLTAMLMGVVLLSIPIYVGHLIARAREKTDFSDYALIGGLIPIVLGLMMFVIGVMITLPFVPPMIIGMIVYRKYAGLEPMDLPEDIIARERRTLVGAEHVRRRMGRVVGISSKS